MDYREKFIAPPGEKVRLDDHDPAFTGKHQSADEVKPLIAAHTERMTKLQQLLYADGSRSLLIVLQALDAGGKDGAIRRIFSGMNPQGTSVVCFKQPTPREASHDFLWRIHAHTPGKGEVVIFNRSHYEDVLVTRVHNLVPRDIIEQRYELINQFESSLTASGTAVLKFFLHITPQEQLARFRQRLEDPARQWKISEADYTEREFWPQYSKAYEKALANTSTRHAPWYIIPSNHKWFRDLAISQIVASTLEDMNLKTPPVRVDLAEIAARYHAAAGKTGGGNH